MVVCFIAGERADQVARLGDREVVRRCLEQLDRVFATQGDKQPASSTFMRSQVVDWSQVRGSEPARMMFSMSSIAAYDGGVTGAGKHLFHMYGGLWCRGMTAITGKCQCSGKELRG